MIQIIRENPKPVGFQGEAITKLERDLLISAGAGSGKTWVLSERYLEILSQDVHPSQIVAITFTKKAAGEMKGRIRKAIQKMAKSAEVPEEQRYWEQCEQEFNQTIITTIDGFCTEILRANPLDAGLSPEFKVLDGMEAELLKRDIFTSTVRQYLEKAASSQAEDQEYKEQAVILFEQFGSVNAIVESALILFHMYKTYYKTPGEVLRETEERIEKEKEQYQPCLAYLDGAVENIRYEYESESVKKKGKTPQYLAKMKEWLDRYDQCRHLLEGCSGDIEDDLLETLVDLQTNDWGNRTNEQIKVRTQELRSCLGAFFQCLYPMRYKKLLHAMKDVLNLAEQRYKRRKDEHQSVDFHDMEILAAELLMKEDVSEKWQNRIQYIMVDEFQDTNALQKEIIDRFSGKGKKMNVFVVGDGKQSIYKFRGADIQVFYQIEDEIIERGGQKLPLDINFRTQKEIIYYINALFAQEMVRKPESPSYFTSYEALVPHRESKNGPMMELLCAGYKAETTIEEQRDDAEGTPGQDEENIQSALQEAELMSRRIKEMVMGEETLVWRKGDGAEEAHAVRYQDISILLAARTNLEIYELAFQQYNIPYVVIGGRDFYQKQEVLDIINLLRVLETTDDEVSLLGFLRSPMAQIHDITLFKMTRKQTLRNALFYLSKEEWLQQGWEFDPTEWDNWVQARNWIQQWREWKRRDSAYSLLRTILHDTGYMMVLMGGPNGEQRTANVEKFLRLIRELVDQKGYNLYDVLQHMERLQEGDAKEQEEAISDRGNAVVIMTVHASKGLEFPVVFLPELSKDIMKKSRLYQQRVLYQPEIGLGIKMKDLAMNAPGSFMYQQLRNDEEEREKQEAKRLLYVAMTRAKDHLVLVTSKIKSRKKTGESPTVDEMPFSWLKMILSHWGWTTLDDCLQQNCVEDPHWKVVVKLDHQVMDVPKVAKIGKDMNFFYWYENKGQVGDSDLEDFPLMPIGDSFRKESLTVEDAKVQHLPSLSASALKQYKECPRRFYLKYVEGMYDLEQLIQRSVQSPPGKQAESLSSTDKGTIVHQLLENLSLKELKQVDWTRLIEDGIKQALGEKATSMDTDEAVQDIQKYLMSYQRFLESLDEDTFEDEKSLTMLWSHQPVFGKLDRIQYHSDGKSLSIYDFKTNKLKGNLEKAVAPYLMQGYLYVELAEKVLKKTVRAMTFVFLETGETYSLPLDQQHRDRYRKDLSATIDEMKRKMVMNEYPACGKCICRYFE